jgi:hypothetical protein
MPKAARSLAVRRWLVRWVRQVPGVWNLWTAALIVAVLSMVGVWAPLAMAVIGLAVAWEIAGRAASSYAEIQNERLVASRGRRSAVFLASATAAWACLALAIRQVGGAPLEGLRAPLMVVMGTTLGAWMVFGVFRQWWRGAYGFCGLTGSFLVGVFAIASTAATPNADATIGEVFVRLSVVWIGFTGLQAVAVWKRSKPAGAARGMRMLWLAPAQAGAISLVLRPPGSLTRDAYDAEFWVVAAIVQMASAAAILGVRGATVGRDVVAVLRSAREFGGERRRSASTLLAVLAVVPAVAAAPVMSWAEWTITAMLSLSASGAASWLGRAEHVRATGSTGVPCSSRTPTPLN